MSYTKLLGDYAICGYCNEIKTPAKGWHDCEPALRGRQMVIDSVRGIWESVTGGNEFWGTQDEVNNRRNIESQIVLHGGAISEEWLADKRRV